MDTRELIYDGMMEVLDLKCTSPTTIGFNLGPGIC